MSFFLQCSRYCNSFIFFSIFLSTFLTDATACSHHNVLVNRSSTINASPPIRNPDETHHFWAKLFCQLNKKLFRKKTMLLRVQPEPENPACSQMQLVHLLCPHQNVVQSFEVEEKDSLDEHLDCLTRKLAEKEGRLRLSKSKIRETQNEIESLHAIDIDLRLKYRDIMDSLRFDLTNNEKECKKLQEQIEWVSRRRAEIKLEMRRGQKLYGEAAAELATSLSEVRRGRADYNVTEKPQKQTSANCLRHRKEPQLPRASLGSVVIKSPPGSQDAVARSNTAPS